MALGRFDFPAADGPWLAAAAKIEAPGTSRPGGFAVPELGTRAYCAVSWMVPKSVVWPPLTFTFVSVVSRQPLSGSTRTW